LSVAATQLAAETPFYSTWWFWTATAAGVVATGAAVTGVVLALGVGRTGVDVQLNAETTFEGAR